MRRYINWLILGLIAFILFIVLIIFKFAILPIVIKYQVGKTLALVEGSETYKIWVETPIPVYLNVYMMSVENPEEVLQGKKPKIKEYGPYVYSEKRKKHDIKVNEKEDVISYNQGTTFAFEQEMSGELTEDDLVTLVNPMILGLVQVVENLPVIGIVSEVLEYALPQILGDMYTPFVKIKVKDLLFNGLSIKCNHTEPNDATRIICSAVKHTMPLRVINPTDDGNYQMAIFKYKNTTYDGPFEVYRGIKNIEDLGRIVRVKGMNMTDNWSGDDCNRVKGFDMSLLPPFITKSMNIPVYSTDICSAIGLTYVKDVEFSGIPGYRFGPDPSFLGQVTKYPENYCFCPGSIKHLTNQGACLKDGVLDISSCMEIPILISRPHFYKGSKDYQSLIDGLTPSEIHETYIDVEPTTGIPLRGARKIQINLISKPISDISMMSRLPTAVLPILWINENVELKGAQISMLKDQFLKVTKIVDIVIWCLVAASLLVALIAFTMSFIRYRQMKRQDNHED